MKDAHEFKRTLEQLAKEKGLSKEEIIESLIAALKSAIRKEYGLEKSEDYLEVRYDESKGSFEVVRYRQVVEHVEDPSHEISLEEARKEDPDCEIGDEIGQTIELEGLGRISAHLAKQVIRQRMRDIERYHIYNEYKSRVGEIVQGTVRRIDRKDIIVDLGRTEAILPYKEQIPSETYKINDRIKAYLKEVIDPESPKGRMHINQPQLVLSRSCDEFLIKLFEREVPEINEGIVQIVSVARDPGQRAKIAVTSKDPNIDPVGACVGMRGSRVQNIVNELKGERIDIVPYADNPVKFVCNALAPAEILKVIMYMDADEQKRSMDVIVADDKLAQAIGTKGQNVRLASKVTKWDLHVYGESEYRKRQEEAKLAFANIKELPETTRELLVKMGYTLESLTKIDPAEIAGMPGIDGNHELAEKIIKSAIKLFESGKYPKLTEITTEGIASSEELKASQNGARKEDVSDKEELERKIETESTRVEQTRKTGETEFLNSPSVEGERESKEGFEEAVNSSGEKEE